MLLSPDQQERYSRHLLLDRWEGVGQEMLLEASVRVRGTGLSARWAARYLAASGVGRIEVEDESWSEELRLLGPWLEVSRPGGAPLLDVAPHDGASPAASAEQGARAALDAVRAILAR